MIEFGTGGWRAIIGDEFTKENVQRLSLALARRIKEERPDQKCVIVGYDRRFLSKNAAEWICEVLAWEGIRSMLINREAPTPMVMFAVKQYGVPYGIAVTASHNPALYNGIKLFTTGGRDASVEVTNELGMACAKINAEDIRVIRYDLAMLRGLVQEICPQNEYIDAIIQMVDMDAIRQRGLHIILDPMYGVSRTSLQTILLTARCEVDVIHERYDTLFGSRLPAPTAETLKALQNKVLETHANIGIATDGDADRLGIIDDNGSFVHPNQILILLYYYLLKYKGWRGPVIRNISTTHILDKMALAFHEKCYEVPVGFKYISAAMEKYDAIIGGESSGGLAVRGHIYGKDGIFAAMLLVEMLAVTGCNLSELLHQLYKEFGFAYMVEYNRTFHEDEKEKIYQRIMEEKRIPDLDGCKLYFKNGWLSMRLSGTEPKLRIFCEMPTQQEAERLCYIMDSFLNTKEV